MTSSGPSTSSGTEAQARRVLETLAEASPDELRRLSFGLEANRHLGSLGLSLFYLASDREDGEPPSALTLTTMQVGLQLASTAAEFRERLDEAEDLDEFWAAVRAAI